MNTVSRHGCARRTTRGVSRARKAKSERDDDELTSGGRRNDDDERTSRMTAGTEGRRGERHQDSDVRRQDDEDDGRNRTSGRRQEQDVRTSVKTAKVWKRLLPYQVVVRVSSRSPGRGLFSTKRCAGLSYLASSCVQDDGS